MKKHWLIVVTALLISGCATVYTERIAGTQSPTNTNQYRGVLYVELGALSDAKPYMENKCKFLGGLNENSINNNAPSGAIASLNSIAGTYWSYECKGIVTTDSAQTSSEIKTVNKENNEAFVDESSLEYCRKIGRPIGTNEFNGCVRRFGESKSKEFKNREISKNNEIKTLNSKEDKPEAIEQLQMDSGKISKIEDAKIKCGKLGIEKGTERFGKCVLTISR
ncbi:MAG: hypothetical protein QUV35_15315 [Hydrogenophaga sp.]|uniref:hypothetical protein n=1 Tax=Hydrogenophaga sp. TaxID=1904254 RepID=UPI0026255800|nr:hypothetical protein [Hydrogenophaga sp.]MDM7943992.1 hypothetical protein [Hydrogenophaga sp.]